MRRIFAIVFILILCFNMPISYALKDTDGINLALGKTISGTPSSTAYGGNINFVNDDNKNTFWEYYGIGGYIQIDFEKKVKVDSVELFFRNQTADYFQIMFSDDENFSVYDTLVTVGGTAVKDGYNVDAQNLKSTYRYMRIFKQHYGNTYLIMSEICVFGKYADTSSDYVALKNYSDIDINKDAYLYEAVNVLSYLDIMGEYEQGQFNKNQEITRAQASKIIAGVLKLQPTLATGEIFSDVPKYYWVAPYIEYLYNAGYIKGTGSGLYSPEKSMKADDFATLLINALGYKELADESSYNYIFTKFDITKYVGTQELTRENCAKIIYKVLSSNLFTQSSFGESYNFTADGSKTLLSENFGLRKQSGIITATEQTSLFDKSRLPKGQFSQNEVVYKTKSEKTTELLGYNSTVFLQEISNEQYAIIAYKEPAKNSELIIEISDVVKKTTTNNKLVYNHNDKEKEIALGNTVNIIYNGVSSAELELLIPKFNFGEIKLLDNDKDGKYEVLLIENYTDVLFKALSKNENTVSLFGMYDPKASVSWDESEIISAVVQNKNLKKLSFESLEVNDVVSVCISEDKKVVKLIGNGEKIKGTITETTQKDGKNYVTINNKEYMVSEEYIKAANNNSYGTTKIECNITAEFVLNFKGCISGVVSGNYDLYEYGYLTAMKISDGIEKKLDLKIFTLQGITAVFQCDEKIMLNSAPQGNIQIIKQTIQDSALSKEHIGQLIRFKRNSKSKITALDTIGKLNNNDDDKLTISSPYEYNYFANKPKAFWRNSSQIFLTNDDTIILTVPKRDSSEKYRNDENSYKVKNLSYFTNGGRYYVESYCENDFKMSEIVVVYEGSSYGDGSLDDTAVNIVVDNFSQVYKDEIVKPLLNGYKNGSKIAYSINENVDLNNITYTSLAGGGKYKVEKGDVIRCKVIDNEIHNAKLIVRAKEPTTSPPTTCYDIDLAYPPRSRVYNGVIKNIYGNYISITVGYPTFDVNLNKLDIVAFETTNLKPLVYNEKDNTLKQISVPYLSNYIYDSDSYIFADSSSGTLAAVVIYSRKE